MGNNNLYKIENTLRSIAKRCKTVKYSLGLAILFLMLGGSAFSEEINNESTQNTILTREEITSSKENLKNSVGNLQSKVDSARAENQKTLKGLRLELIQLMEQGDQVVKSPWASWQFGLNYMYSKWNGAYKGKGDKAEKYPFEGVFTRSTNFFERVVSPLSEKYEELVTSTNPYDASSNARNGLGLGYGLASTEEKQEPIVTIEINAAIKPKSIQKSPISLDFIPPKAPTVTEPDINQALAPSLSLPEPKAPSKQISIVKPNASPFTGFFFNANNNDINLKTTTDHTSLTVENFKDVDSKTLYAGIDPNSVKSDPKNAIPALKTGAYEGNNFSGSLITEHAKRPTNILYRSGSKLSNLTFFVRGYFGDGSDGYIDAGSGHSGGSDTLGGPTLGTIGVHTLLDTKVENVKAYLYGRAGFLTSETWRNGKVKMTNTKVDVYGKENSVFYIMPSAWGTISEGYTNSVRRKFYIGSLEGTTNVNLYGSGNNVYLSTGISGARWIQNDGDINSYGASNIVYSGMSYVPNWEHTYYQETYYNTAAHKKMQSRIQLSKINLLGDENVGLFFGSKMSGNEPKSWETHHRNAEDGKGYIRKASYIGIYQGEIDIGAKIGVNAPRAEGKLNKTGYTDTTVDGAVGVFVQSGQRTGISPTRDLGVPHAKAGYAQLPADQFDSDYKRLASLDDDKIHNLEISRINIHFGKYSKNGFMVISKLGSVVDIGKATTHHYITNSSASFTDGINGASTTEDEAATGTVVTYAEGVWKQSEHKLGTTEKYLKDNNDQKPGSTAAALEGKSSEINVHIPLIMTAKEGIAYMGDNQGIVNAKGKTTAVNYGAIIGYARNKGKVTIDGEVEAVDKNTTSDNNKFKNIGAFAESGGEVEINKKVTINGIGAFAKGANSKAQLLSGKDEINAGTVGGMVATEGGYARLDGGIINIRKANSRLFYADATGRIDFTKDTTINMSKGIILPQEENNASYYNDKTMNEKGSTPTKYNGMKWVTINLLSDDVVLKTVNNHVPETWNGSTDFESGIQNTMKYKKLEKNGHTYKVYYTNGEFKIAHNIDLDNKLDVFNSIIMGDEKVTINSGISITSNTGKGLVQAALPNTVDNSKTGYVNNGIVNIGGGKSDSIGIRVNHGSIENNNLVKINNGIGLYGSNGSKILNNTAGKIEITSPTDYGIGIAGFLSGATAQNYGTDKTISSLTGTLPTSVKTIDITNNGKIKISGKAVGIYANNTSSIPNFDKHVTKENAVVNNNASLSFGNDSIGIFSKKATINLTGTGTNDISVGERGIGVYAKDSSINFKSDYGFQIKDNGRGIYAEDTDTSSGNMKLNYIGRASSRGIGMYFTGTSAMRNRLNLDVENISGSIKGMIGIYASAAPFTNEGNIKIKNTNTSGFGIVSDNSDITNKGNILLEDSLDSKNPNIAVYMTGTNIFKNLGSIKVGKNSIGVYTKDFINGDVSNPNSTIEVGENGIGVYSIGGNGNLEAGNIKVGKDGIGIYAAGNGGTIHAKQPFTMTLGNGSDGDNKGSFGFVNVGTNNKIISDITNITLQNNSIYIYSKDKSGTSSAPQIKNNTNITATGKNNYGIYSAGYGINTGNMNLQAGTGNVGMYSVKGGTIENRKRADGTGGVITVGGSISEKDEYGIGMAAGYSWTKKDLEKPISQRPKQTTGNIINRGTINVNGEYSIGMYGSGKGTTVENHGNINLNANNTTGIYLNDRAVGHNYGTITNSPGVKDITAVVVRNGAKLINEPTGVIRLNAENAIGAFKTADNKDMSLGVFENYGIFEIKGNGSEKEKTSTTHDLNKSVGNGKNKTSIDVPAGSPVGTIKVGGKIKTPEIVDTNKNIFEKTQVSSIGMYINTSGDRFTRPITGLSALKSLKKADLIIGVEAARKTNSKYIQIGQNILEPYNKSIRANPQIKKWNIYSGSLTWMANISQKDSDGTIQNAYLAKIAYPVFAKDKDTYNFTDGLEQRYGVESLGSRENELFQKLNKIGNNEEILLYQAFDEMMGHQYANVQQRINATGNVLDKEFDYLRDEWQNVSKDSNKIKIFGTKGEYKTDTAGVIDYKNYAYGVAYVHEDEDIKLGRGIGWYTGIVHNTFKFKDIGKSKEEQLQGKVGLLKSMPFDDNNSLNWTISGDIFAGYNKMSRKFLVVDEIFNAKAKYHIYGIGVKNQLTKSFRISEDLSISPYISLELEYGRVSKIREKTGEVRLEVKHNDYISVKPEVGTQLAYRHYFGDKTLRTSLGVAYENELGKLANGKNKARVVDTAADYFNIRGEKENRKGNVKFDLNVGLDNTRVGVTTNVGYDTKGHNIRGGLGLRVIF